MLSLPLGPGGSKRFGLQTCPGLGQTNLKQTVGDTHLRCTSCVCIQKGGSGRYVSGRVSMPLLEVNICGEVAFRLCHDWWARSSSPSCAFAAVLR